MGNIDTFGVFFQNEWCYEQKKIIHQELGEVLKGRDIQNMTRLKAQPEAKAYGQRRNLTEKDFKPK